VTPPAQPADRREPLPSLFGLPGHLLRQLSPRWRRVVLATLAVLVAAGVVTAIVLGPRIAESNRERAAEQRRADRQAQERERARLAAEQRPRFGRVATGTALFAGVEAAITRDARARHATGELKTLVRRTDCHTIGRRGSRIQLSCTAITSEVAPSAGGGGVLIGYPYASAVAPATRRYAICKTSGRPGEGSFTHRAPVELPAVCGGEG
jgi:type II secretory pathway pseudopilin PulG